MDSKVQSTSKVDSDGERSPSDDEKAIGNTHKIQSDSLSLDPDDHLSAEEKARIVSARPIFPAFSTPRRCSYAFG
jgi:hypothetical protein